MSKTLKKLTETNDLSVTAIVYGEAFAILSDGRAVPVVTYIDIDGENCDQSDAVACVAGSDDIGWWSVDLRRFGPLDPREIH